MGQVRWTEEAASWLREIHDHIAQDNPAAALLTVRGIYKKVQSLDEFPERGFRRTSRTGRPFRIVLFRHYRIAYSVNDDKDVTGRQHCIDVVYSNAGTVAYRSKTRESHRR